jgi:hypothetical protein
MESSIDSDSVVISCSSVVNQHSSSEYIEVRVNEHVFISSLFFFLFALFSWKIEDWWLFFFFYCAHNFYLFVFEPMHDR